MILETSGANFQTGKTKSKTHIETKSCITNCLLLQLSSLLRHKKFRALQKFLCHTFETKYDLMFHLLPIFDLLLYEKYIPHKFLSTFV